jgi:hypothetical protein
MSTLVAQTLSNGTVSTSTDNCIQGSAKAWVNFNGTGTVSIRSSFNVSSITDGGAGIYTVNFTTAMPNANYAGLVTAGDYAIVGRTGGGFSNATRLTGSYQVVTLNANQSLATDCDTVYVAIFSL